EAGVGIGQPHPERGAARDVLRPRRASHRRPHALRRAAAKRCPWSPERNRRSRIAAAISSQWVSSAKWPVSKKRTSAFGMSRLNASAPGGRKKGSFLPHTARKGGLCLRKYS